MNKPFSEPKQAKPPKSGQLRDYGAVGALLDSAEGPSLLFGTAAVLLLGTATALLLRRRALLKQAGKQVVEDDERKPGDE